MRIAALLLILALMVGSAGWIGRGLYPKFLNQEAKFIKLKVFSPFLGLGVYVTH